MLALQDLPPSNSKKKVPNTRGAVAKGKVIIVSSSLALSSSTRRSFSYLIEIVIYTPNSHFMS